MTSLELAAVDLATPDPPAAAGALASLGFDTADDGVRIGAVSLRLHRSESTAAALTRWVFRSDRIGAVDHAVLPETTVTTEPPAEGAAIVHPNGAMHLDHVVAFVSDVERFEAAFEAALAVKPRRRGDVRGSPALFYRAGEAFLEVVGTGAAETRLWGLSVAVHDLDAMASEVPALGRVKAAVQGGRIASAPVDPALGVAFAFQDDRPA